MIYSMLPYPLPELEDVLNGTRNTGSTGHEKRLQKRCHESGLGTYELFPLPGRAVWRGRQASRTS